MKHIIISGCSRGIGAACAQKFLDAGWCVTGMGRSAESLIHNDNFYYVSGDLASSDDRKKLVSLAIAKFGQIDALVNVAGVAPLERRDLLEMTEESYDRVMEINTKGTLFLTQAVANEMIKNNETNS